MFSLDTIGFMALQVLLVLGYSAVVGAMIRKWHEAGGEGFFPLSTPRMGAGDRPSVLVAPREQHGLQRAVLTKNHRALELWQEAGTRSVDTYPAIC